MKDSYVPRKCIRIETTSSPNVQESESLPLEDFRQNDAYILLGSPGAGKTTAFEFEAEQTENGCYVKVRDLLTFQDKLEWRNQTLFIDGLDELTEGFATQSNVDEIRRILYNLDLPKFRLACKSADWFRADDLGYFKDVSPTGKVSVLLLAPLTDDDILEVLNRDNRTYESEKILEKAKQNNIYEILKNPLNLKLFAELRNSDGLPDNRTDLYERICKLLLQNARPPSLTEAAKQSIEHGSNIAGKLCTHLLLSGHQGFCLNPEDADDERLYLGDIDDENWDDLQQVLNSRLFDFVGNQCFKPIHSQVAEFLAARFTADLIDSGIPYTRIFSYVSCESIGISQPFRGLAAWLASLNLSVRNEIISRVPLSVALYGDVKKFSDDEKNRILENLSSIEHTNEWIFDATDEIQLGNLVTTDTVRKLQANLESAIGVRAAKSTYWFLLNILKLANLNSKIKDILFEIVRHNQIDETARTSALEALTLAGQKNQFSVVLDDELWRLLHDVLVEKVADSRDELLGTLLEHFYPRRIPASEIVEYLKPRKKRYSNHRYYMFWFLHVCEASTSQQLENILDALAEQVANSDEDSSSEVRNFDRLLIEFPQKLLKTYLEKSEETPSMTKLSEWLGIVSGVSTANYDASFGTEDGQWIKTWIENNSKVRESIIEFGVGKWLESCKHSYVDLVKNWMYLNYERRLFDAQPSASYGLWCLNQAINSGNTLIAEYFICEVAEFTYFHRCNEGISRNSVKKKLAENKHLLKLFEQRLSEFSAMDSRNKVWQKKQAAELVKVKSDLSRTITDSKEEILQNKGRIDLLYQLARIYFGRHDAYPGNNPVERIEKAVGDNTELVEVIMEGLKSTVQRSDIPNHNNILRTHSQSKHYFHGLPFLAGLNEIQRIEGDSNFKLNERQLRQALALFFVEYPISTDYLPDRLPCWYEHALCAEPRIVAEILVAFERANWKKSKNAPKFTYELASDSRYKTIAKLATEPLLKAFPIRCPINRLIHLGLLLKAALLQYEASFLQELIRKKIAMKNMTIAQLGYWLIAGLLVASDEFFARIESYTSKDGSRVRYLTDAIKILINGSTVRDTSSTQVLSFLIEMLGARYSPPIFVSDEEQDSQKYDDFENSILVQELIHRLVSIHTADATKSLEKLVSDRRLDLWKQETTIALTRQKLKSQEAQFKFSRIKDVRRIFRFSEPVSAEDLAAISIDHIKQLGNEIRCNSTSDWRQYWNVDKYGRPNKPKPENACRDTFVSDLKHRLRPLKINIETEAVHTCDNKSDFQIFLGEYGIPVEVKRSSSTELWISGMEQLRNKYAIDPRSNGYGIYLVFWFGTQYLQNPPQKLNIDTPRNVRELKNSMPKNLSTEGMENISICVIDVSIPENLHDFS